MKDWPENCFCTHWMLKTTTAPSSCSRLKSMETPITIRWPNFVTKIILWHQRIQKTRKEMVSQGASYFLQIPKDFSYALWRVRLRVFSCFVDFFKLGSFFKANLLLYSYVNRQAERLCLSIHFPPWCKTLSAFTHPKANVLIRANSQTWLPSFPPLRTWSNTMLKY